MNVLKILAGLGANLIFPFVWAFHLGFIESTPDAMAGAVTALIFVSLVCFLALGALMEEKGILVACWAFVMYIVNLLAYALMNVFVDLRWPITSQGRYGWGFVCVMLVVLVFCGAGASQKSNKQDSAQNA